jgi:hypothetical protein
LLQPLAQLRESGKAIRLLRPSKRTHHLSGILLVFARSNSDTWRSLPIMLMSHLVAARP